MNDLYMVNSDFVVSGLIHGSSIWGSALGIGNYDNNHYIFEVDSNGNMHASSVKFKGEIVSSTIISSDIDNKNGFKVNSSGRLICDNNSIIANWNITPQNINSNNIIIDSTGSIKSNNWSIDNNGIANFTKSNLRFNSSQTKVYNNGYMSLNELIDGRITVNNAITNLLTVSQAQIKNITSQKGEFTTAKGNYIRSENFTADTLYTYSLISDKITVKEILADQLEADTIISVDRINVDNLTENMTTYVNLNSQVSLSVLEDRSVSTSRMFLAGTELKRIRVQGHWVLGNGTDPLYMVSLQKKANNNITYEDLWIASSPDNLQSWINNSRDYYGCTYYKSMPDENIQCYYTINAFWWYGYNENGSLIDGASAKNNKNIVKSAVEDYVAYRGLDRRIYLIKEYEYDSTGAIRVEKKPTYTVYRIFVNGSLRPVDYNTHIAWERAISEYSATGKYDISYSSDVEYGSEIIYQYQDCYITRKKEKEIVHKYYIVAQRGSNYNTYPYSSESEYNSAIADYKSNGWSVVSRRDDQFDKETDTQIIYVSRTTVKK